MSESESDKNTHKEVCYVTSDSEVFCRSPQGSSGRFYCPCLCCAGKIRSPLLLVFYCPNWSCGPAAVTLMHWHEHREFARTHRISILDPFRRDWSNDQTALWISLKSAPSDRPLNQAVQRRQNIAFSPLRNCRNYLSVFHMTPLWNGKVLLLDAARSTLFTWC